MSQAPDGPPIDVLHEFHAKELPEGCFGWGVVFVYVYLVLGCFERPAVPLALRFGLILLLIWLVAVTIWVQWFGLHTTIALANEAIAIKSLGRWWVVPRPTAAGSWFALARQDPALDAKWDMA